MMSALSGEIRVTVGPYSFVQEDDDAPDPDYGSPFVVDGLTVSNQLGDDQLWPMQGTGSASFSVFGPTFDDVSAIVRGALVVITWTTPRTNPAFRLTFEGRVTDARVRPHLLGVVVEVTAIDAFTFDWDVVVGDSPWPEEDIEDRLNRIAALLGTTITYNYNPAVPGAAAATRPIVRARDVDAQPALGIVRSLLESWVLDYTALDSGLANMYLEPVIVGGVVTSWEAKVRFASFDAGTGGMFELPGMFGDTTAEGAPGYGVTIPDHGTDRSDTAISTDYVDLSGTAFTQRKGTRPNRTYVQYWAGAVEASKSASNGLTPPLSVRFTTDLIGTTGPTCAQRMADLYLPEPVGSDWYADTLHYRLYADDDPNRTIPRLGDLLAIAPIQDRHNPLDRPWYAGIVTQSVFLISKFEPVVELTITPQVRAVSHLGTGQLTWDDLPAGVTWDDLNTRDTWDDYQLLRG
jgi:hypothetical protein